MKNPSLSAVKVYMFPGLGAEYSGMLENFCLHYSWAESTIKYFEQIIGISLFDNDSKNPRDKEYLRQLQIHCLNLLWWRTIKLEKQEKIICCGHSLGFYAALVASGALTEQESWYWLTTIFDESWRKFSDNPNRISVLTTTVAIDAHRLAKQFSVEIIARNSEQQIVIYGQQQNISKMCNTLEWATLRNTDLDTVIPFHSITMCQIYEQLLAKGEKHKKMFLPPQHEVWSHLTGERIDTPKLLYLTLLEQPMRTVEWQQLIKNLNSQYHPEFIEVGPNRILSQLVRWTSPKAKISHIDHLKNARHQRAGAYS